MTKTLFLAVALCLTANAQIEPLTILKGRRTSFYCTQTVTSAVPVCSIEIPSSVTNGTVALLEGVKVRSDVSGETTFTIGGTRTGGTTLTAAKLNHSSNVSTVGTSGGSVTGDVVVTTSQALSNTDVTTEFVGTRLYRGRLFTVKGPSMTGTFRVTIKFLEGGY